MATEPAPQPAESIAEVEADLKDFYRGLGMWNIELGPIRMRAEFNSMRLAHLFVGFHILLVLQRHSVISVGVSW